MPKLHVDQLTSGLRQGRPIAPFSIDLDQLDKHVERAIAENLALDSDSLETVQLFDHFKEQLEFLVPERKSELMRCEVYVLPFPLCIAYAHELSGRRIIVISEGLIDLVANTICSSLAVSLLPKELDTCYLLEYRKDMPASHLFANALFLLQLHFYRFCSPLPNPGALLTPELREQSKAAVNGALLFILLHELGHHALGHLDNDEVRPMRYGLVIQEALSVEQRQEMDADMFALDCLLEPARLLGTYWRENAVNFFVQMELVSGRHSGFEHPTAINRAYHSDALRAEVGRNHGVSPRPRFFAEIASRFADTRQASGGGENAFINTSREGCLRILDEIDAVLAAFDREISPIWTTPAQSWLKTRIS